MLTQITFSGGGADYAEMFEWADGNSERRHLLSKAQFSQVETKSVKLQAKMRRRTLLC